MATGSLQTLYTEPLFTIMTTQDFIIPTAINTPVDVNVTNTAMFDIGGYVYVRNELGTKYGTFKITSTTPTTLSISLDSLSHKSGSGIVAAGAKVTPSGKPYEATVPSTIFIDDLADVYLPGPLTGGEVLTYDATDGRWEAAGINVVSSVNGKTGAVSLTTADITEGTNLYYTSSRVQDVIGTTSIDALSDVNKIGWAEGKVWGFDALGNTVPLSTAQLSNVALVDLTDVNISSLLNGQTLTWNATASKFVNTTPQLITSTDDVPQGATNKYYSNTLVSNWIATQSVNVFTDVNTAGSVDGQVLKKVAGVWQGADVVLPSTTDDLPQGLTNKYYSNSLVNTWASTTSINAFSDVSTSGSADGQVLKRVAGVWQGADVVLPSTTDDLPQGSTNKYYSNTLVNTWAASASIDVFSDVNLTGWSNGQVLGFNASGTLIPVTALTASTTTDSIAAGSNPARQYYSNTAVSNYLATQGLSVIGGVGGVGSTTPQGGQALIYNATTQRYEPSSVGAVNITLTYTSDGDAKGLISWCGTTAFRQSFSNPANRPNPYTLAVVLSSNLGQTPSNAIDRNSSTFILTANQAASRFVLDLGTDKSIRPNYYTIRGRADTTDNALRSWKLQGSVDSSTWEDLDTQTDNTSITISSGQPTYFSGACTATTSYRYISILLNGPDSSGAYFLTFSEFEVYGTVSIVGADTPTTTDDLPEGSTNLYYTNTRVQSYLDGSATVNGSKLSANSVSLSKLPTLSLNQFWAKPSSGTGDAVTCTLGTGFSWNGTTLNVSVQGGVTSVVGQPGDVTAAQIASALNVLTGTDRVSYSSLKDTPTSFAPTGSAGGDLSGTYPNPTIASNAVTFAKFQQVASGTLLGRSTVGTGNVEAITLGSGLTLSSGVLSNTVATFGSFYAASPTVKNIPLFTATRATTINELRGVITASGTATLSIQINGVNVTGLSNLSITSSSQNFTATGGNTVSVGARVTVNITAVSLSPPPADLEFTMGATLN